MILDMARKRAKAKAEFSPRQLLNLRKRLKFSRAQAAEAVGVSPRTWMYYEQGKQIPSLPVVLHIRRMNQK